MSSNFEIVSADSVNSDLLGSVEDQKTEKLTGLALRQAFETEIRDTVTPKLDHKYSQAWTHEGAEEFGTWEELSEAVSENESYNTDYERKVDQIEFSYQPDGFWVGVQGAGDFRLAAENYSQVWSQLGLPTSFHKVAQDDTEIELVNQIIQNRMEEFKSQETRKGDKKGLLLRCRNKGKNPICRAVLSERYGKIPHSWSVEGLRALLGNRGKIVGFRPERYLNGESDYLRFNVMLPDSIRVIEQDSEGSEYCALLTMCNHEAGGGSWFLNSGLARRVCANSLIIGHEVVAELRKKHLGTIDRRELLMNMEILLRGTLEYSEQVVDQFQRLITDFQIPDLIPVENLIASVTKQVGLQVAERKGIYGALYAEETADPTAATVINAVTRYAGSEVVRSEQRRWQIEDAIGEIADQWLADPKYWERDIHSAEAMQMDKEYNRILNATLAV